MLLLSCIPKKKNRMACSCFMDMGCSRRNMWDMSDGFWWLLSWLQTSWRWLPSNLGSLQPRVSSSLYIEMGEFADEPSSLPNVQKRMAVQRVSKLWGGLVCSSRHRGCFGMISCSCIWTVSVEYDHLLKRKIEL
jgi:hypothetical protein